ncbi:MULTISPECIES: hypothetical protein [Roseofilum]|uniref:Uncharacterized protein n=2 Tax=Roseofilum TaxID=1233426 RepID=A0ABT7BBC5_9CYAN|nr:MULTISPECIES: hypothetical protein [Roseofilum]MDJ1172207.1 hypothetical protein [Roseofilum acuticapitatum BLCC-M154]MDJ1176475.1 hypothetical protein [Roseofilum capinflatum BLCC-M114]
MLSIELDKETEAYLVEILGKEKTTSDELIKRLVKERWLTLQPRQTIVERRGGHPEHLLEDAPPDLSERANRKKAIANYLQKKYPQFDPQ